MKNIITLFLLLIFTLPSLAVDSYMHVNVGGGLNTLAYPLLNGTRSGGLGGTANVGYSHFFTEEWGLQTCLGVQSFSTKANLNYISSSKDKDLDGEDYFFRVNFKNLTERQQTLFLDIPLAFQYRHIFTEDIGLMATLGAKMSIPIRASYKTSGSIFTSGYYPQYNGDPLKELEMTNIDKYDFITDKNSYTNNLILKTAYAVVMDLGALYRLSDETDLYAGAYFNYGLNNILTPDSKPVYERIRIYNGLLSSSETDYVKPISFGVKVGLYFHLKEYIPAGKSDLVAPKTKVSEIKLPTKQTQASKVIQRGKVVEAKDILEARRIILANKELKEKLLVKDSIRKLDSIQMGKKLEPVKAITTHTSIKAKSAPRAMPQLDELVQIGGRGHKTSKAPKPVKVAKVVPPADSVIIRKVPKTVEIAKVDSAPLKAVVKEVRPEPVAQPVARKSQIRVELPIVPTTTKEQEEDPFEVAKRIAASFNIRFEFSSINMVEPDLDKLKALSEILKAYPYIHLNLSGHTDNVGSLRSNFKLGGKRTEVVKVLFVGDGVPDENIATKSKAYLQPKVPNTSEENKALNRRVEVTVEKHGKASKQSVSVPLPRKEKQEVKPENATVEYIAKERIVFGRNLAQMALKYYGSRDFWVYIYQANKENVSNPNKISFGTLIRIPKLDASLIDLNNPECVDKAKVLQSLVGNGK